MSFRVTTFTAILAMGMMSAAGAESARAVEQAPLGTPQSLGTPQDEEAIHQLLVSYQEAWNKKDPIALASLFSEEADFSSIYGQTMHGRVIIADKHSNLFKGPQRESQQTRNPADVKIRFLKPDVAAVDSIAEISGVLLNPEGTKRSSMNRALTSMVLVKRGERWEIEVFHNMILPSIPMPPAAAE